MRDQVWCLPSLVFSKSGVFFLYFISTYLIFAVQSDLTSGTQFCIVNKLHISATKIPNSGTNPAPVK